MPGQGPAWTEFLSCHVCCSMFDEELHRPISLGCGHTVCRTCLNKLPESRCPFDQSAITCNVNDLPANYALLQLVGATVPDNTEESLVNMEQREYYDSAKKCVEDLAVHLKADSSEKIATESEDIKVGSGGSLQVSSSLSRPMQRKLVSLVNCQLLEEEGRSRAMRTVRSLGERTVTELILQHQNPHQLSANLWAAVRARGCQFLGPAMQEEVLKLILLVLEDASALSRKVLVLFVVQHLEESYPQASKTAIGHVVQLLYRASCFKVTKREEASSVMQLKEEFRTYDALRREHDSQIVQIAMEAGLRISPEQWSSLLYGDASHKSHMQSIIDKLQTPLSFSQSISELTIALQRTGDPCSLHRLRPHLEFLANIDPSPDSPSPSWENLEAALKALRTVVQGFMDFFNNYSQKKELLPLQNARYKTSMCRDQTNQGICPRGTSCTFAHSQEELEKYRARSKKLGMKETSSASATSALSLKEKAELERINKANSEKLAVYSKTGAISASGDRTQFSKSGDRPLTVDTPVVQSLNTLSLSPRNLSPLSTHLPKPNSGIPDGSTTPSVVTPAHYRKPGLGMGTSVKETHYQGMTKMSPCEISAVEGGPFMCHPFLDQRGHPRGLPPHPSLHCPQDPGFYHPPCGWTDNQPPRPAAVYPDDWGVPHQHYCQAQQDMMYPYTAPQRYCPSHEMSCQLLPPSNYPAHNNHRYYSRPAPHLYSSLPPQAPMGADYSNQDAQSLNDLHVRRNNIIAQLNQNLASSTYENHINSLSAGTSNNSSSSSGNLQTSKSGVQSSPGFSQSVTPAINKSVADTYVAARTMFSLANSGALSELQTSSSCYVPWSSDDSDLMDKSDAKWNALWSAHGNDKNVETKRELENEDDDAKQILSWLDEEKANLENDVYKSKSPFKSLQATQSYDDQTFIPFDPPLVSKFGPISRMARAKPNNTDPVQVTADEVVRKVMPVTAVTQMDCPVPVAAPVPSRFSVKEMPTRIGHPMFSLEVPRRDHFLMQNDPTRLSRQQMMREVVRLETKAQDAVTEDESLALELQAIELKISLKTPDNLEQAHGKRGCSSIKAFGHQKNVDQFTVPSVRPSDPALTAEEQKKLHQLTAGFGGGDQRSEYQERILSQLLKIKELGNLSKKYHFDH